MRKRKMTGHGVGKRREPNAATKLAIREAQRREGLETFEPFADWEKSIRKLSPGVAKRTKHN